MVPEISNFFHIAMATVKRGTKIKDGVRNKKSTNGIDNVLEKWNTYCLLVSFLGWGGLQGEWDVCNLFIYIFTCILVDFYETLMVGDKQ